MPRYDDPVSALPDDQASTADQADVQLDGRHARRHRNVDLVLRTARSLFVEETVVPTIEQISQRSGISMRSLYRYFGDIDELFCAAIDQALEEGRELARIDGIAEGPFANRVEAFVGCRVRLYETMAASFRATVHHATANPQLHEALETSRAGLRLQFEAQFEPELGRLDAAERQVVAAAGDALCQFDTIDLLRRSNRCTIAEAEAVLRLGIIRLISNGD